MFVNGTPWPVIVVTKFKLVVPVINLVKILCARLGHVVPSTMKVVVHAKLHTRISATVHDIDAIANWLVLCARKLSTHIRPFMHRIRHGWKIISGSSKCLQPMSQIRWWIIMPRMACVAVYLYQHRMVLVQGSDRGRRFRGCTCDFENLKFGLIP